MERCEKTKEVRSFYLARSVSEESDRLMQRKDVLQELTQAEQPLREEIAAGRSIETLADELIEEECFAGARRSDLIWALATIGGDCNRDEADAGERDRK